ncbi:DUF503 domain-containing protein [Fervidibacillus halotolerans]|uniref:DUF503 family protein n=1 Tax=Fervidibacillus halotolerans TaxID=2980027 RepID=A0A9E8RZP0_9BACI|nr:DUF503 family protein [Fervidibacillus halotolerans]WAA13563.1 DUF503 family protein [Fervidibacillus halotolerans]
MILSAEIECYFYHCQSLKDKRAILQRILTRIRQKFNFAVAEIDFQNQWQRSKIALVTVSTVKEVAEKEYQQVLKLIDSFPEIELTITEIEWL